MVTPYTAMFLPIFVLGCVVACSLSVLAAFSTTWQARVPLLVLATAGFWIALYQATDLGYRSWQSTQFAAYDRFSDAAVQAALVGGWFPGGIFSVNVLAIARRYRRTRGSQSVSKEERAPRETGNPYQPSPD
ncbi:MAG: hypothetical protein AAFX06_20125 [Planctomycetota bacterium]